MIWNLQGLSRDPPLAPELGPHMIGRRLHSCLLILTRGPGAATIALYTTLGSVRLKVVLRIYKGNMAKCHK